jgi:fumarylacetoacetase
LEHVKNAGRIIINNEAPPPAFFNFPIGYQGRASSIMVSGSEIVRPMGQFRRKATMSESNMTPEMAVIYGPSAAVDYEVEFAAVIGKSLPMWQRLNASEADDYIFGFVLLNDWSGELT